MAVSWESECPSWDDASIGDPVSVGAVWVSSGADLGTGELGSGEAVADGAVVTGVSGGSTSWSILPAQSAVCGESADVSDVWAYAV